MTTEAVASRILAETGGSTFSRSSITKIYESVEIGMIVWWYPDGDPYQPPHPAMVTRVNNDSLCVNIFGEANMNMRCRDGVRHIDDDRCRREDLREEGGWDHTGQTKDLQALRVHVQELARRGDGRSSKQQA